MSFLPWRAACLAGVLLPSLASAAALTLGQALDLAVQRSATLRAAQAGQTSALESARAAGQLPDPVLGLGVDNLPVTGPDRLRSTADGMTMKRVGISQEWLSADKRAAQRAVAQALADREAGQVRLAASEARLQVALAYVDAYYAAQSLTLSLQTEQHGHEEFEASKARLAATSGSAAETLALRSALGQAEDESAQARQARRQASLQLQRWTGQLDEELDVPQMLVLADEDGFVARHPAVLAAARDVEVARQEAGMARLHRQPNWTWALSYGQRSGYADMVSVGVSIPLPIAPSHRQDRETAAKLARVEQAEALQLDAQRSAAAQYRSLADDAQRLTQRLERYRSSVLEPATQRTGAALGGYRGNQNALSLVFEARHAELDARRKLLSLQRELARTQAQLAFRPVPEGEAP